MLVSAGRGPRLSAVPGPPEQACYQLLLEGQPPLVVPPVRLQERVTVPSVALAIENEFPVFEVTVSV
jgi:hypothetical protein